MLSKNPISPAALLAEVSAPELGGACLFLGTVRDGPDDGGITGIEYSAYEGMAVAELERLWSQPKRWALNDCGLQIAESVLNDNRPARFLI